MYRCFCEQNLINNNMFYKYKKQTYLVYEENWIAINKNIS